MTPDDGRAIPDAVPRAAATQSPGDERSEEQSPPTASTPRRPITPGEAHQADAMIARAMTVECSKLYAQLERRG